MSNPITLSNGILTAIISPKGAELQSLVSSQTNIEYMWSGDAAYWGKHSPVLFPIVGSLKNDTYYYNDQPYKLPRHGFARERIFDVEQVSESLAIFTLMQDENSADVYPFPFTLSLRYRLDGATLACTYEVHNPGSQELLFSVGAHPAFAVPMVAGSAYTDYYLQFNHNEPLSRWKLEDGLVADSSELIATENGKLPLDPALFYEDAIVLKHLKSTQITLASNAHEHGLHFKFNAFDYFGIWAAKDAPFVCLEPWSGIADSVNTTQQLTEKEGIEALEPKGDWARTWEVECF